MKGSEAYPRIIMLGDSGVGKTSLIGRGVFGSFNGMTVPTVGAGVTPVNMIVNGTEYNFHIWDTAGQEIYRSIIPLYFRYSVCAIAVFAVNEQKSFQNLSSWLDMLASVTNGNIPVVIVGNKIDSERHLVAYNDAKEWADQRGYTLFYTSAATGENVQAMLEYIAVSYVGNNAEKESQLIESSYSKCC